MSRFPDIEDYIRYKDEPEDLTETTRVLYINTDLQNIVVEHIWFDFGKHVSYFGIPFSEYYDKMEIVK